MFKVRIRITALLVSVLLVTGGCSGSRTTAKEGVYRESLGTADYSTLVQETRDALLSRYGFRLYREVTSTEDVRFETEWKEESAYEDERQEGATHARTRIVVTARPRNRSTSTAQSYAVQFVAETELRELGSDIWQAVPMTEMREDFVKRVARHLKTEFQTALR